MDTQTWSSDFRGNKGFTQWDVHSANATGFGAAADDYMDKGIDLNEQLIQNKAATFFMRMNSEAMIGAGIHAGDILVIDRSIQAFSGKVVVACLNGEMMVRRLEKNFNKIRLVPDKEKLAAIDVDLNGCEFFIWGVVTWVIHRVG